MDKQRPTLIKGIRYYNPPVDAVLTGLDGKVRVVYGDLPVPLLEEDFNLPDGGHPSYDAVGRGIYHALRSNPDCVFGQRYAELLRDAYPHFLAELASHIVMLDKKDADAAYLDRKINYLKIFALIEPENPDLLREIGVCLLDKGMSLATVQQATLTLYQAERFLRRALQLAADDVQVKHHLGEVSYLLGKYENAASFWRDVLAGLRGSEAEKLQSRLQRLEEGKTPLVPVVDYLEALGIAFDCHQRGEFAEAAAILLDVIDDAVFREDYAMPEIWYLLASCYADMAMPKYAEDYLREALRLNPSYAAAQSALDALSR
jgi:tetratricopeptide (TPR) repeat protein